MKSVKLEARKSIMIYSDDEDDETVAIMYTKISNEWGEAKCLSNQDILSLIDEKAQTPYCLPPEFLWYEEDKCMMWYCPPAKREIKWRGGQGKYSHPGLVFLVRRVGSKDMLSVAPVTKSDPDFRPHHHSPILEYPYRGIDVHSKSGMMGHCRVTCPPADLAYCLDTGMTIEWENAFFLSQFNYRPTDRRRLKETNTTIHDWIEGIWNAQNN